MSNARFPAFSASSLPCPAFPLSAVGAAETPRDLLVTLPDSPHLALACSWTGPLALRVTAWYVDGTWDRGADIAR